MNEVITTISSKGQITLPKKFRDALKITSNSRLQIKLIKKSIIIEPAPDLLDILDELPIPDKPKKKTTDTRAYMESHYERF